MSKPKNRPRRFFELFDIADTVGLPDGKYTTLNPGGVPHRPAVEFKNGQWPTLHEWEVSYLRPLAEGTRVLQPGEVAVKKDHASEFVYWLERCGHIALTSEKTIYDLYKEYETKLAQMGDK